MGPAAPPSRPRTYRHSRENALSERATSAPRMAARARPTSSSRDQLLPWSSALAPLFPRGGLQRGGVVTVGIGDGTSGAGGGGGPPAVAPGVAPRSGSRSSPPPRSPRGAGRWARPTRGSWPWPSSGWTSAVSCSSPGPGPCGPRWPPPSSTAWTSCWSDRPGPVRPGVARRLAARARERRGVLVVLGSRGWPEGADVQLTVETGAWQGVEAGHGHLQGRHLEVVASGRRAAARPVRVGLWLPAPSGQVEHARRQQEKHREVEAEGAAAARHLVPGHP